MLEPWPQRTMLISSITARGLTSTTSCMNVPLSSENGPNDIACEHPITSVKKAVAAFTSGTVMPFRFDIAGFKTLGNRGSARRRQLTFDRLRIMRETLGNAARHVADIDFFLAGLESIEDFRRGH